VDPRTYLRTEGAAVFVAATAVFFLVLETPWWLYLLLVLAPDLSMIGYLSGPARGTLASNLVHSYVGPLALAVVGLVGGTPLSLPVAVVWPAHIGADRTFGYGLKHDTGSHDTHLGRVGRRTGSNDAAGSGAD
jgi:hypothetical protein